MKNKNFYSRKELLNLNVVVGKNCQISKKVSFYSKEIKIGNRCRIDDDVVLKGKIQLKNNVHISRGCTLSGDEKGIFMDDFSGLSNYVQIFSTSDSYGALSIPSATLDKELQKKFSSIIKKKITIGKCVLVGAMSLLLPGTEIGDFSRIGALSIVLKKIKAGSFYSSTLGLKSINDKKLNSQISKYNKIKKLLNE